MRLRGIVAGCTSLALAVSVLAVAVSSPAAAGTSGAAVPLAPKPPAVTAISPADGGAGDQTQVTIHGSGFTGVTSVLFGSTAATRVDVASDSVIVALGPAEGAGTVSVRVVAAGGTSPAAKAGRFTFLPVPRSTLSWAKPFRVAGNGNGYPAAVSCPDAHDCVAVDDEGDVITWNGTAWSAPSPGLPWAQTPQATVALSCPATTWCAVAGGDLWTGHGHAWTGDDPGGQIWYSVSCASAAFCMAATAGGWVSEYSHGTWSAAVDVDFDTPDNSTFTVSCGAVKFCVAMDDAGTAYWWNGTDWNEFGPTIGNGDGAEQVSCASAKFCMAIDGDNVVWTFNGKTWTDTGRAAPVNDDGGDILSCTAATFCMLAGESAARYNGKTWSKFRKPVLGATAAGAAGGAAGLGCAGQTCALVAAGPDGAAVIFADGAWGAERTIDNSGELDSVSCPSASFCVAVGIADDAVDARRGHWQQPDYLASAPGLESVSCLSATFCLAADDNGGTWRFNGSSWSRALQVPGAASAGARTGWSYGAVACVSTRFCAWAGVGLSVFNGTKWTTLAWSDGTWAAVGCASATLCVAGDNFGNISVFNGRSWSKPRPVALNPEQTASIACVRPRFCVALDVSGGAATFNGTTWNYTDFSDDLTAVSCTSTRFCAAASAFEPQAYTFNGTLWSQPAATKATPAVDFQTGIACASPTSCVLIDVHGDVMLGR